MLKVSVLAVCIASTLAAPAKFQTNNGDWCIITDFPRLCSNDATRCAAEGQWARFLTQADCEAGGVVENTNGWCHTSWFPATCALVSSGNCIANEYPPGGFATEADCIGPVTPTPVPTPTPTAVPTATAVPTPTPVPTGWCHTSWWPAACGLISAGGCVGSEYPTGGYASETECLGGASTATGSGYCHTSWWPVACALISSGNCVGFEYPPGGYASLDLCIGNGNLPTPTGTPGPTATPVPNGWCHTSWWPETCALISAGNCIANEYPVGGFASENDCLSTGVTATPVPTPTVNPSDYCITQWWPKTCGLVSAGSCLTTTAYADEATCLDLDGTIFDNQNSDGYCVSSWWPMECVLLSTNNCLGWYPPNGWATEAGCLGESTKILKEVKKAVAGGL